MKYFNPSKPEDAIWVSCPKCDALPGDPCPIDPSLAGHLGFDKAVHQDRIRAMENLTDLENEE